MNVFNLNFLTTGTYRSTPRHAPFLDEHILMGAVSHLSRINMNYVYHRKPEKMEGHVLFSLSKLKDIHPLLHKEAAKKYIGREQLLDASISDRGNTWQDVIHFGTIHPYHLYSNVNHLPGYFNHRDIWYQIPVSSLPVEASFYYPNNQARDILDSSADSKSIVPFRRESYQELRVFPDFMKHYIEDAVRQGIRPLLFQRLPHIFVLKQLDIKNIAKEIVWSEKI